MNKKGNTIHHVIALICGLAIIGYVYGVIPLDEITGTNRVGPVLIVIGVYLVSKVLLVGEELFAASDQRARTRRQ